MKTKAFIKKIYSVILTAAICLSSFTAVYASAPALPDCFSRAEPDIGTQMPFNPPDKYSCMQNPPDFSWPRVEKAESYDIEISSSVTSEEAVYSKNDIKNNYCNFSHIFEPGTYYWRVRAKNSFGASEWSSYRRFRIDPDYTEFTVPDTKEIAGSVPETHPRIWMTQETISDFRALANTDNGQKILNMMLEKNKEHMAEPSFPADPTEVSSANEAAIAMGFRCQLAALCYIFENDTEIADYAVRALKEVSSWDIENNATAFDKNDQAFFEVLSRTAMAYDWMYNYMQEQDRITVRSMLEKRFNAVSQSSLDILRKNPYNSHIWSCLGNYGTACMALINDVEGVDGYFSQMLELYIANLPPMSTEDGGWSKGTAYWTYAFTRDKYFMDILKLGGYIDCYKKAWAQNEYLWALYMMPPGSYGSFGDASNEEKPGINNVMGLSKLGKFTQNPAAYWERNKIGTINSIRSSDIDAVLFADTLDESGAAPVALPNAHVFPDQGIAALHSSLTADERISMYFRSGAYGSYNHMHADQNSFMIEAFGERLAIKSGYYDYYHSPHDSGFTRQTFAHNSVTFDNGQGQKDDDIDADGNIDMFLTHHDFDVVVGDGTKAYDGGLDSFVRSIIYIRPDVYIVIDDLKAKQGTQSEFEWRLNAPYNTLTKVSGSEAVIKNGEAVLETEVLYPNVTSDEVMQSFEAPDGSALMPSGAYAGAKAQDRIYFKTQKTSQTKIITAMQVHKQGETKKNIRFEQCDDYVRLTLEDGTVVLVNITDDNSGITADGISFIGRAAVLNSNTVSLVGGMSLAADGREIITADREISAVIGRELIGVSSDDDACIALNTDNKYFSENVSINDITDDKGRRLSPIIGIDGAADGNILNLSMQKGHYMLKAGADAVCNAEELLPQEVRAVRTGENTAAVSWAADLKANSYDIRINGTVYENVSTPYRFYAASDTEYAVSVRANGTAGPSSWSEEVYLNPVRQLSASYAEFEFRNSLNEKVRGAEAGGSVSVSEAVYNGSGRNAALILAGFGSDGTLKNISLTKTNQTSGAAYEKIQTPQMPVTEDNEYFKAFLWDMDTSQCLTAAADTSEDTAGLSAILIDGKPLDGFSPDIGEYSCVLDESGTMPSVKGVAENNSTYVTVSYAADNAKITAQSPLGQTKVYKISFSLPENCEAESIIPLVSDFKQLTADMSYEEYCNYIGKTPDENETSDIRIKGFFALKTFSIGADLCGTTSQRKITRISKMSGFENCYFIAPDSSVYQTGSSAPWIVAAFTGDKIYGTNGTEHDFSLFSVPWLEFKVNRDCEVIVLSQPKPECFSTDNGWIYTQLDEDLYSALRTRPTGVTNVPVFKNMYTKEYKAGSVVQLNNENCGVNSDLPYITIIRFK